MNRCLFSPSLKQRRDSCQDFVHEWLWQGIHFPCISGGQVDYPWLVTANHACRFNPGQGNRKTKSAGEFTAIGNGQDHWQFGGFIEFGGRYNEDRAATALFMTSGRVE
jgi:hypothetical protein